MRSKDPCDRCDTGHMLAYCTRTIAGCEFGKRFLKCNSCGNTGVEIFEQPKRRETSVPDLVHSPIEMVGTCGRLNETATNPQTHRAES